MKRFGILSLLFFVSILHSVKAEAQVYAKLNGLYALVGVINPAVEFRLTDHSAFQTEFVYSPWQSINVDGASKPMHFGIFLNEYRYYFRGYARGWYVGGNVGMMAFRMSKPYVENWGIHLENRYSKGYGMMIGICGGFEYQFADRWLLDAYFGISPLMARELSFRACGETDGRLCNLDEAGRSRFQDAFFAFANCVKENSFTPIVLKREGVPFEFSALPVHQYGLAAETETFESFSALLDSFYEAKERQERVRQRGADLIRTATTARGRVRRKLALQEKDYAATQERDALRLSGDLITANLYRMERGESKLVCQNYYDEDLAEVTIPLDPLLTPQQNAAKYYKRYTKAKTAEKHLREQIDKAIGERDYLESVQGEIALAQTEAEFAELRRELQETGYLRRSGKEKKGREKPIAPREFRSSSGLRILVGRSNVQNDALTRKADKRDLWLHTQKIHGSHVILCTEDGAYDDESLHEAALLAAYYSQAQGGSNVPVDYTSVKYVKKPAGARPGMVVYETYRTLYVTPDEETIRRLDRKNK